MGPPGEDVCACIAGRHGSSICGGLLTGDIKECVLFSTPHPKAAGNGAGEPKLPVQRTVPGVSQKGPGGEAKWEDRVSPASKRGKVSRLERGWRWGT